VDELYESENECIPISRTFGLMDVDLVWGWVAEEPGSQENSNNNNNNADEEREERDPNQLFSVLVPLRSFLKFLNSHVVSTTTIACTSNPSVPPSTQYHPPNYHRLLTDSFIHYRHMPKPLPNPLRLHRRFRRCGWGVDVLYTCDSGERVIPSSCYCTTLVLLII